MIEINNVASIIRSEVEAIDERKTVFYGIEHLLMGCTAIADHIYTQFPELEPLPTPEKEKWAQELGGKAAEMIHKEI